MIQDGMGGGAKARLREQIDENLRRVYDSALQEEIPDRFKQLLQQLRAQDGPGEGSKP